MHQVHHNNGKINLAFTAVVVCKNSFCCSGIDVKNPCLRLTLVQVALRFLIVCAALGTGANATDIEPPLLAATEAVTGFGNESYAEFTKVADGVYVRYGSHEPLSRESIANIANHGFIVGEAGVAIVDPGGSINMAKRTLAAIRQITALPVTHVIVSHVHPDHSLGLAAYADGSTGFEPTVIGHSQLAAALNQNLEFFTESYTTKETTGKLLKLIQEGQIKSFEHELTFDLGSRKVTVASFANAHSGSDITVYDQQTKSLWSGDLLFVERLPAIDGSILGWIDALERLGQYDITTVIPGHGASGNYELLVKPQLDYLNLLVKNTRYAVLNGMSLSEYISNSDVALMVERSEWKLAETQHAVNMTKSYAELEWE